MVRTIANASEQYRQAIQTCREIFLAAGKEFVEPNGVSDLLNNARVLYTELGDEAGAVKEVDHAREWLIGIAVKFLRGGVLFFEGKITELSYMSLDSDIMDNMRARFEDYREAVAQEENSFERRIASYSKLAEVVAGARTEQFRRTEHREEVARKKVAEVAREARERRREADEQEKLLAQKRQEEAEAEARVERAKRFDELFS